MSFSLHPALFNEFTNVSVAHVCKGTHIMFSSFLIYISLYLSLVQYFQNSVLQLSAYYFPSQLDPVFYTRMKQQSRQRAVYLPNFRY